MINSQRFRMDKVVTFVINLTTYFNRRNGGIGRHVGLKIL